ncbi:DUF1642 domain-containing protein [Enterococcus faecalis]|uniref:DUF1642 domain-containing protein n=1 Tax=Enterococcus faecalis TaxID=1351 RepID=UPI0019295EF6|nr:DUF1642 domain-containing protein [Enterococcus faecalis]
MSKLTKLQKISALSKDLMNKKMNDTDRFVHLKFTEQEIKAVDERYWLFAVKVDGE